MNEPITVKLLYGSIPVKDGEEVKEIDELVMYPIKAKDLKKLDSSSFLEGSNNPYNIVPLISLSTRLPVSTIEELDFRDLVEIGELASPFFPKSRQTGKK